MLRVGAKLDIFITTVEGEENRLSLWAQTDFDAWQELEKLLETFGGARRQVDVRNVKPGDICLAKCHEEDVWYRARVVSVGANAAHITVNFIDFGNNEVVNSSDIAVAPDDLFAIPPQAQKFILGDIGPTDGRTWSSSHLEYLKSNLQNVQCTCMVIREGSAGWPPCIRLFDDESQSLLVEKFTSAGIGRRISAPQSVTVIPNQLLTVGQTYEVAISHPMSAVQFWIQLVHNKKDLVMLQEVLVDSQQVSSVSAGQVCIARHKGDYQRAVVTAVHYEKGLCSVMFVDYGNSDVVPLMSVLSLDNNLARIPAQAVPCCLAGEDVVQMDLNDAKASGVRYVRVQMVLKSGVHVVKFVQGNPTDFTHISSLHTNCFRPQSRSKTREVGYKALIVDIKRPLNVCISHVGKMGEFSCQLLSNCQVIDSLMIQLQTQTYTPMNNLMSGMTCLVQSTKDGIYYRGLVRDFSLQQVLVDLVDFGDVEVTSHSRIFELPERFTALPRQAFTCTLTKSSDEAVIPLLHNYEGSCSLVAVVLERLNDVHVVELIDTSSDADLRLSELACSSASDMVLGRKHPAKPVAKVLPVRLAIPEASVDVGCCERLYVTAVRSESEFFGQLSKYSQDELVDFQNKLMTFYGKHAVPALPNPQIGDICCTTYSEDGLFYRGLITECGDKLNVFFIDYGNNELKSRDEVKELHAEFCKFPVQGILCRLSPDCARLNKTDMEKCLLDNEIVVTVLKRVQNIYEVKIHGSGLLNSTSSIAATKLRKITVPVGTQENVLVVHTQDPGHFYCQLIRSTGALDSLMSQLENYGKNYTGASNDKPEIGTPVVAKYTADDEWYRAVITGSMANGDLEVQFVDYGNHEVLNPSRIIPTLPEFLELPCQAICCCLADVSCKVGVIWPQEAITTFSSLVADVDLVMVIKECSHGDRPHKIELYHNEECINWKFVELAESYVSRSCHSQSRDVPSDARTDVVNHASVGNTWAKGFELSVNRSSSESSRSSQDGKLKSLGRREREAWVGSQERGDVRAQRSSGEDFRVKQQYDGNVGGPRPVRGDATGRAGDKRFGRSANFSPGSHWQHDDRGMGRASDDYRAEDRRRFGGAHRRDEGLGRPILSRKDRSPKGPTFHQKAVPNAAGEGHLPIPCVPELHLKEGQTFDAFVSYADSPSQFWCQPKSSASELERLMQELNAEYSALRPNDLLNHHPSKLQICCAKYSADGAWYRAKITSCHGEHITVYFVDYGNSEDVIKSDIKFLKENYLKLPFQAFQCILAGAQPVGAEWSLKAVTKFQDLVLEKPLIASIVEKQGDRHLVKLTDGSLHIHSELIKAGLATSVESLDSFLFKRTSQRPSSGSSQASMSSRGSQQDLRSVKCLVWPKNKHIDVNVVLTRCPSEFWCQLTENTAKIQQLMDDIDARYGNVGDDELRMLQPEVGQVCCAKYSEDGQWYRAILKEIQPGKVKVTFIDYGNDEWLEESDVRELESSFIALPSQAIQCSLYDVKPTGDAWSEEATALFESLTAERNLVAKLISKSRSLHQIRLIVPEDSIDVGEELVQKGVALHPPAKCFKDHEIELGSSHAVLSSWVYSSQDFYIQLKSNNVALLTLVEEMFEFYQRLKMNDLAIQDPRVGKACVAYHAEDGNWFRSTILKLVANEVVVMYVDFGTKAKVPLSKVKEITTAFLELPCQAIRCSLANLMVSDDNWPEEAKNLFKNAVQTTLDCTFLSLNDGKFEVELRDRAGVSVAESINNVCQVKEQKGGRRGLVSPGNRPSTAPSADVPQYPDRLYPDGDTEVFLSNVTSPTSFAVQLASEADELEVFAELVNTGMVAPLGNVSVGVPCGAKSSLDDMWYRAIVTAVDGDQAEICFVDYGDSSSVPVAELRSLPGKLLKKMPFSINCRLHGVQEPAGGWSTSDNEKFEELTVDKKLVATFKKKGSVCEVSLRDGTTDIAQAFLGQTTTKDSIPQFPTAVIPNDTTTVFISHVDSPGAFHVNLASQSSELDTIVQELASFTSSVPLSNPSPGCACAAIFSEDGLWYRASVNGLAPSGCEYEVQFVDYGNSGVVKADQITALPDRLLSVPVLAVKCCLDGVDEPSVGWPEDAANKLLELGEDGAKELLADFITYTEPCKVRLVADDVEINKVIRSMLEADKMADVKSANASVLNKSEDHLPEVLKLDAGKHQVMVIHVEGIDQFYIQLARDNVEVEQLVDAVDTKYGCMNDDDLKLDDIRLGMLCCAKYSGNGLWQRASVCARTPDNDDCYEVYFVDFGNKDTVPLSSLKQLTDNFRKIPPRLYRCRLHGLPNTDVTGKEMCDKFISLTQNRILTADVKSASDECEVVPVTLWDKDECINIAVLGDLYHENSDVQPAKETEQPIQTEREELETEGGNTELLETEHENDQLEVKGKEAKSIDKKKPLTREAATKNGSPSGSREKVEEVTEGTISECDASPKAKSSPNGEDPVPADLSSGHQHDEHQSTSNQTDGSHFQKVDAELGEDALIGSLCENGSAEEVTSRNGLKVDDEKTAIGPSTEDKECSVVLDVEREGGCSQLKECEANSKEDGDTSLDNKHEGIPVNERVDSVVGDRSSAAQSNSKKSNKDHISDSGEDDRNLAGDVSVNAEQTEQDLYAIETFGILHDSKHKQEDYDDDDDDDDHSEDVGTNSGDESEEKVTEDGEQSKQTDLDNSKEDCDSRENQTDNIPEVIEFATSVKECILSAGERHDVFISHIEDPGRVWCQIDMDQYADIMEAMAEYYSDNDITKDGMWSEGDVCCVTATEDGDERCHRAEIISCTEKEACVLYLDMGKTEKVKIENLKPLIDRFGETERLAVRCSLHGIKPAADSWTDQATDVLANESEQPLVMQVVEVRPGHLPEVSLSSRNGSNLADLLVNKSLALRNCDED